MKNSLSPLVDNTIKPPLMNHFSLVTHKVMLGKWI